MTEQMSKPNGDGRARRDTPGMPRWVKVSAAAALAIAIALLLIMLAAGGEHGPGLHTGAADPTRSATAPVG